MVGAIAVLLIMGLPLAFVTGAVAMTVAVSEFGLSGLFLIESRITSLVREFVLVAVPMFILMASVLERSGVARDLYRAMHILAGGLRGGLAIQTMVVAVLMAAMTGIIGGEIILLGLVALPQMLRLNYDRGLAIGTICAGGSLGTMIPPSIVLIIYGLTAGVDIGQLFVATVMPGLLLASIYVGFALLLLYFLEYGKASHQDMVCVLNGDGSCPTERITNIVASHVKHSVLRNWENRDGQWEMVFEIRFDDASVLRQEALIQEIQDMENIRTVSVFAPHISLPM